MKTDAILLAPELGSVGRLAAEIEHLGGHALLTAEIQHDPFLPLAVAMGHTRRLGLGTCVAVASPRSPMHLAQAANDLHRGSAGRFILGLGSQIKPHIENRYGAVWSKPVARMGELVRAVRAVWRCWNEGEPLSFEGEFHRLNLMTPMFDPGPNPHGSPPIFLGAVGPAMTELAGEVADGLFAHAFATERSVRELTIPALERGLDRSGRKRSDVEVSVPIFLLTETADSERERERDERSLREQLAFYGSTPAYRRVLEVHGWGDLQAELNLLSKRGWWGEMASLISDEVVDAFAVRGAPNEIATEVRRRYGSLVERVSILVPHRHELGHLGDVIRDLSATRPDLDLRPSGAGTGRRAELR
ncbi:MAG: TIGR03617 family F420-dependent LLM class oxidoreductase [Acidimicrobiia bacterium]